MPQATKQAAPEEESVRCGAWPQPCPGHGGPGAAGHHMQEEGQGNKAKSSWAKSFWTKSWGRQGIRVEKQGYFRKGYPERDPQGRRIGAYRWPLGTKAPKVQEASITSQQEAVGGRHLQPNSAWL